MAISNLRRLRRRALFRMTECRGATQSDAQGFFIAATRSFGLPALFITRAEAKKSVFRSTTSQWLSESC